jgi:hypothetical protein
MSKIDSSGVIVLSEDGRTFCKCYEMFQTVSPSDVFTRVRALQPDQTQDHVEDTPEAYGYPVHKPCWAILETVFGSEIKSEPNGLEDLMRAVRQSWPNLPCINGSFQKNPLKIPTITLMFKKALKTRPKTRIKFFGPSPYYIRHQSSQYTSAINTLPPEIQYMILDQLEVDDLTSILSGLGWTLPKSYWRHRFKHDLFFEVAQYSETKLHWETMVFLSEKMLQKGTSSDEFHADVQMSLRSRAIPNRMRILGRLKTILIQYKMNH